MPELPEVETVKESLKLKLKNRKIKEAKVLYNNIIEYPSVEDFINNINNQAIIDIKRRGKWLMFELEDFYLLSHLRMEGKYFLKTKEEKIIKHEHVIFTLDNDIELRYMDTRKFGKMHLINKKDIDKIGPLKDLGLEPWDNNLNTDYLKEKLKNKRLPIKTILLDQSIIVGIGNIYADEILFLSKLNPLIMGKDLKDKDLNNIIINTRKVLEDAIKKGGTTIRSYTSVDGVHGRFQNELLIHEQKICSVCKKEVKKIKIGGRGTYYCLKCQK